MNTYNVIDIATGLRVYSYSSPVMVEWSQFPYTLYDHVLVQAPGAVAPQPTSWTITTVALRLRFTLQEQAAIYAALPTDSTVAAYVNGMMAMIAAKINVNLSDTTSQAYQGAEYLVSIGVLTSARLTAIFTTPPLAGELP